MVCVVQKIKTLHITFSNRTENYSFFAEGQKLFHYLEKEEH
jgi:hypothetical protein